MCGHIYNWILVEGDFKQQINLTKSVGANISYLDSCDLDLKFWPTFEMI